MLEVVDTIGLGKEQKAYASGSSSKGFGKMPDDERFEEKNKLQSMWTDGTLEFSPQLLERRWAERKKGPWISPLPAMDPIHFRRVAVMAKVVA